MPVGTQATVKGLDPRPYERPAPTSFCQHYHLMLRPGAERIAALGGLHQFMNWPRPIPHRFRRLPGHVALRTAPVEERCVTFRSHLDGAWWSFRPSVQLIFKACLVPTS